jgi:DNA-binding beta-propeller fold protein YncE
VRFDYQWLDTTTNRLYISHMNAGEVLAFDLENLGIAGVIKDLPHVTGVCVVPELGKIYASVPGRRHVAVIDASTLRIQARVGKIGFPDGIAYAPDVKKVYVSDESGGGELVIDGRTNEVVTTIPLDGEAGNTIFDPGSGRILVAIQTQNEIAEIDPRSDRVVARHELPGADHPHGMALDPVDRLLFVANEGNAMLLTFDLNSMRVVDKQRVAEDPDVLAYDALWRRLYVAAESGVVSVFTVRDRRAVHEGDAAIPHAHTVSVDPRTHFVYLPLQNIDGHPVLRIMRPRRP